MQDQLGKPQESVQKHTKLSNSIESLDEIVHTLDALLNEISPRPAEQKHPVEVAGSPMPSLNALLCEGPQRIAHFKQEISGRIGEIRDLIF